MRLIVDRPVGSSGLARVSSSIAGRCRSVGSHPEVALELVEAPVDVDPRVTRVVTLPDRDGRSPEPVAAYRPVTSLLEPLAERSFFHVGGDPVDPLVQLEHPVPYGDHLHEPRIDRLVDEGRVGPPAVRVAVRVALGGDEHTSSLQVVAYRGVGVEDVASGVRGDLRGEPGLVVDRAHDCDARRLAQVVVLFTETGSHVDDAGSFVYRDEVAGEDPERAFVVREEIEQRAVGAPDQPVARHLRHRLTLADQLPVGTRAGFGEHDEVSVYLVDGVEDLVSDGEREVRRKGPGRRRPHEQVKWPVDPVGHPRLRRRIVGSSGSSSNETVTTWSSRGR